MADNTHEFFTPDEIDEQIDESMAAHEPRDSNPSAVRAVQTLQHYYSPEEDYTQSLARVRMRLAQHGAYFQSTQYTTSDRYEQQSATIQRQTGRDAMKQTHPRSRGNSRLLYYLGMIAAVVCLTFIVGGMVAVLRLAHPGLSVTGHAANCTVTAPKNDADQGEIYARTNTSVYRLDATTYQPLWQFQMAPIEGNLYAQMTGKAVNGIYYFLGTNRDGYYFYALNAATGDVRWSMKLHNTAQLGFTGKQLVVNGVVYFSEASMADGYSTITALDASTGRIQWQHRINGTGVANGQKHSKDFATGLQLQTATDETLYASSMMIQNGTATSTLFALSARDGSVIWQSSAKTNESVVAAQVIDCVLYISTASNDAANYPIGHVYAYNAATGIRTWSRQLDGQPNSQDITISNGVLYLGSSHDSLGSSGNIYALRSKDGSQLWRYTLQKSISVPVVENGTVYAITSDSSERNQLLIAIDATNGKVQWSRRLPHHVIPELPPAVNGNFIYLSTSGYQVDIVRVSDGRLASSFAVADNANTTNDSVQLTIVP